MPTATVTSKGQITIPAEVRNAMGVKPGERVVFFEVEDGKFLMRRAGSIMEMAGCLAGLEAPKTDEEMNRLLAAYAAKLDNATKSDAPVVQNGEAA